MPVWPDLAIFLYFGRLFKAYGNNYFAQISHRDVKGVKIYHFSSEIILGNFYKNLAIFSGHTGYCDERCL